MGVHFAVEPFLTGNRAPSPGISVISCAFHNVTGNVPRLCDNSSKFPFGLLKNKVLGEA